MDASEGSVLHWSSGAALFEKTLSELETFIQYPYLLGIVYIAYEAWRVLRGLKLIFRWRFWDLYVNSQNKFQLLIPGIKTSFAAYKPKKSSSSPSLSESNFSIKVSESISFFFLKFPQMSEYYCILQRTNYTRRFINELTYFLRVQKSGRGIKEKISSGLWYRLL